MPEDQPVDQDAETRALVARLARPHKSGGKVVERASLLSAGGDFNEVLKWIEAHGGEPESTPVTTRRSGAYSVGAADPVGSSTPQRFVLPAGAFN